jgi:hypothetical protein
MRQSLQNTPSLCWRIKSKQVNCTEYSTATATANITVDLALLHEVLLRPGANAPHGLERACVLVTRTASVIQASSSRQVVACCCCWDHRHAHLTLHHINTLTIAPACAQVHYLARPELQYVTRHAGLHRVLFRTQETDAHDASQRNDLEAGSNSVRFDLHDAAFSDGSRERPAPLLLYLQHIPLVVVAAAAPAAPRPHVVGSNFPVRIHVVLTDLNPESAFDRRL